MDLEEEIAIQAEFAASWDVVEDFYRQTQDFGWSWLSSQMLPMIGLLREKDCARRFYLKESSARLELLRGTGPFVFARHVRLTFNLPYSPSNSMTVTFEAPNVELRWSQKIKMTPRLEYILHMMAAYPIHCVDDWQWV